MRAGGFAGDWEVGWGAEAAVLMFHAAAPYLCLGSVVWAHAPCRCWVARLCPELPLMLPPDGWPPCCLPTLLSSPLSLSPFPPALQVSLFYTAPTAIRTLMACGDSHVTKHK